MCEPSTYRRSGETPVVIDPVSPAPKRQRRKFQRSGIDTSLGQWIFFLTLPIFMPLAIFFCRGVDQKEQAWPQSANRLFGSFLFWTILIPLIGLYWWGYWPLIFAPLCLITFFVCIGSPAAWIHNDICCYSRHVPNSTYIKHPLVRMKTEQFFFPQNKK